MKIKLILKKIIAWFLIILSSPFLLVSTIDFINTRDSINIFIFVIFVIPFVIGIKLMWSCKQATSSNQEHRYDMDSLEGINAIPVPAKNYNAGNDLHDCVYYILQRKATEHKNNERLDLAIACLRKSNELSDYEERPLLLPKDYLRLVKYIEDSGDKALAKKEKEAIYLAHPEFLDKRISNLARVNETLAHNKDIKNDLVFITTNSTCTSCSKYNRKVYSISGKSKQYPKLPKEISENGGGCPNCILGINTFFEGINTPPKN